MIYYSRDAAYLKISATVVYENLQKFLPTIGRQIPMPTNERQLRFLAKAELEPSVQADVWQQAVEQAGNKIPSGRIVKDVVDRIRERTIIKIINLNCVLINPQNLDFSLFGLKLCFNLFSIRHILETSLICEPY